MNQITKNIYKKGEIPEIIDEIINTMEKRIKENFKNHTGGKMKRKKNRFGRFMHVYLIASQIEITA